MSSGSPTIYLVRHAEAVHNVAKDFNIRDPGLTELGFSQAVALATGFPALDSVAVILSSPLRRTIETTITGFGNMIKNDSSDAVKLILDPDLQERSAEPCDTGSEVVVLQQRFPGLDFSALSDGWYVKEGPYTSDDEAVAARAKRMRLKFLELSTGLETATGSLRKDIVVVTHGVFMKYLAQDQAIDLSKAGWKAFKFAAGAVEGRDGFEKDALVPVGG